MAAIVNSGGSAASTASPLSVSGTGAPAATGPADPAATTTDVFEQLIAEMLGANSSQAGAPSSQDLASLDLTGDSLEMPSDDRDSDSEESDEDPDALALAALFSGFPGLAPLLGANKAPPSATSGTAAGGAALATGSIESALLGKSAEIEATESAIGELLPDSAEARAEDADSSTGATSTSGSISPSPANPSSHVHAMLAAHGAGDIDAMPDATLRAPVGTPGWKDELGTQLTWMAMNNRDAASLRLSPEHLGPLEVRISMREGEASVYFGASNPDTRSALEQSLPRLRELFAAQGLVLADAGVSRDAPRHAFKPSTQPGGPRSVSDASLDSPVKSVTFSRAGLIDTYV